MCACSCDFFHSLAGQVDLPQGSYSWESGDIPKRQLGSSRLWVWVLQTCAQEQPGSPLMGTAWGLTPAARSPRQGPKEFALW